MARKKYPPRKGVNMFQKKDQYFLSICFGFVIGVYLGLFPRSDDTFNCWENLKMAQFEENKYPNVISEQKAFADYPSKNAQKENLILIGIMTAKKYLDSRIIASFDTWAKKVPGKVLYFSSEGSSDISLKHLPVIGLKGVDDSYPPQKKSFLMLKYMYEYYGDQFQWFVRADDDIFIQADKLALLLNSINSSLPYYIGQAGLGNKDEFGSLNLDKKENYCMGGPGMVFSRATLMKVVPHVSFCLKNLYTTHEDVEVGRCVQRMAEVSCTWAYEMQHLFFHNHREPNGSFSHTLKSKETDRAITLHPVKNHIYQYRLQNYFDTTRAQKLRHSMLLLHRQINLMDEYLQDRDAFYSPNRLGLQPTLLKYFPKSREEVMSWEFLGKSIYSHKTVNPKPGLSVYLKTALDDTVRQVMNLINHNARQRGRTIDFKEILYGYKRVDPLHGADYILDLLLVYRKHKGRKMTIPVRRHAYLQQTFSEIEFGETDVADKYTSDSLHGDLSLNVTQRNNQINSNIISHFLNKFSNFFQLKNSDIKLSDNELYAGNKNVAMNFVHDSNYKEKVLHFIMPLSGRYDTFLSFIKNFEEVALMQEKSVVLSIMLFEDKNDKMDVSNKIVSIIERLQAKYTQHSLKTVKLKEPFSRGLGLEQGSLLFSANALLVFIDVDMYLHPNSLKRLKKNTIQGKQVYFPIVFSQYDPALYCNGTCLRQAHPFHYDTISGYWRQFGFGIAAMYNSDFQAVGGFDKTIQGWGMEDVKLFETFSKRNYSLFRGVDTGLVHIFHPIFCDSSLENTQYESCLGTKSQTFASIQVLSKMVYQNRDILHRNEGSTSQNPVDERTNNRIQYF